MSLILPPQPIYDNASRARARGVPRTEAELMRLVVEAAHKRKMLIFHSTDTLHDIGPGFPDLVLVGSVSVLWRELKTAGGSLSPAQVRWKYELLADGQDWALWRPADWVSGRVLSELDRACS